VIIPLNGKKAAGRVAIIDEDDYELVCDRKWHVMESADYGPYAESSGTPRFYMHRLIAGYTLTDHINGNGLDNRRINLREATRQQNAWNSKPRKGTSLFKGVCWHKNRNAWLAYIGRGNIRIHLGYFKDEIEAAQAYDTAAREYFGEFAWLNFPHQASRSRSGTR
jgi:hypothetical protein